MIEDKKIENLFRDNQHKLDEMPSPMAWDRLEVRLEKRDLTRKRFAWRRLAVAAAVFIAVSMIGLWTYINPLGSTMNKTTALFAEKELASEIIASDAPAPARPLLMSHREKSQYLTEASKTHVNESPALPSARNKIREEVATAPPAKPAPQTKKPRPQVDVTSSITTTDMTVRTDVKPAEEEKILEEVAEQQIVIADNTSKKEDDSYEVVTEGVVANQTIEVTTTPVITTGTTTTGYTLSTSDVEIAQQDYSEDVEIETEIEALEQVAVERESKKRPTIQSQRSTDKMSRDMGKSRISAESVAPAKPELDRFDWLLGKWTDEDDNSFEEWRRIAPNILEGKGYFVVDVDTTFTQSMQIIHSNAKIFFMVDGQLVEGRFELEKYDDSNAIFKNKAEADEQITLKKNTNTYSVTIEKTKRRIAKERRKKKRTFKRVNE